MKTERTCYALANIALLLAALLIAASFMAGCATFEKARRRYATDMADTTFTTITTMIPRDSVRLVIKTDTTRIIERMRQGRATVTIIREPTYTTIKADCDSLTKSHRVGTKIITQKWGVDPAYKESSERWKVVALTTIALAIVVASGYFLSKKFTVTVAKR